jgi:chromosome partitioning protein
VIDVNPCATFLTRCAIAAADHIVAPVRPEKYSLTGLTMLEQVVRAVRGRPVKPSEFTVVLNGVNDRTRSPLPGDVDAFTRAEIAAAPFFGSTLIETAIPYSGALRAAPMDRFVVNPINVTALMRERQRDVKDSLARAAAEILKRAGAA